MPLFNELGLSLVDIALLAIILVGLPLEALLTLKSTRAKLASNEQGVRIKHYTQTILWLWAIAIPILVVWAVSGRDWAALGFQIPTSTYAGYGWGLAVLVAGFFIYQNVMVARSDAAKAQLKEAMAGRKIISDFMPQADEERALFNLVSVTAGITEEIIFRGYLIFVFSLFVPISLAGFAALVVFTFLHLYQGVKQLPTVFAMGALLTLIFVLSGSIWPAIAVHILVDMVNNSMLWKARTHVAA